MKTSSISWPNLINVAQNRVAVVEDEISVVNRSKLLLLTEPTELYNEPNFGVGFRRHLWQYNNENEKAIIKDRIVKQLRLHEPMCNPDNTQFSDGNLFTKDMHKTEQDFNRLEMTVGIQTVFGVTLDIDL